MTKIISVKVMNLVKPKAGAKHELLFDKPAEASLLNKSSHLAPALDVMKFTIDIDMILVKLCCAT